MKLKYFAIPAILFSGTSYYLLNSNKENKIALPETEVTERGYTKSDSLIENVLEAEVDNSSIITQDSIKQEGISPQEEIKTVAKKTAQPTTEMTKPTIKENSILLLSSDIDLKGDTCKLPKGVTIKSDKGVIKNGVLIGYGTKIEASGAIFDKVAIKGTWNVPEIKTTYFKDLTYDNALKDIFALTTPSMKNIVTIESGNYPVSVNTATRNCIIVNNNTDIKLDGTIKLKPNNLDSYNIIQVSGNNINIFGTGSIIGDKHTHTGKTGEWGMGINIANGNNISISGLTIKECWGDCIYIGKKSRNIKIHDCKIDNGRRQGISITSGNSIIISNCNITNVKGTAPEYAIDIEPNKNDTIDNVILDNINVKDCIGGLLAYGKASKAKIRNIIIKNCNTSAQEKYPILLMECEKVNINNCTINITNEKDAIRSENINKIVITNNTIIKNNTQKTVNSYINIKNCISKNINNNQIK
ncbi:MAG: right-handed parallel beta-helix repeat-containing protein [Phocaeicola sp.]|uniref:right-handed parallel beta-helix repeat-containing protein n=1 Tax=Phocaeicola TaxID=909656 RepID=UPI00234F2768|nr:right-handed parallel beta-helix repeat-containing protein [Phocaeicola oris]MCE2615610.1 right-handed parallel beta-helix repeat-containing protein [Phocaeicola oris]